MEVKPGYKQTEVGVIPEEWVVSLLADVITSFQNGFAFASHGYVKSGIPIVTMAQIGLDGRFNFTSESVNYWPTEAASALRAFQLFRGDIIIAMTDVTPQKNLIGRMAEVTEIGPLLLNQRVGLFRLDAKKIDPYFLRAMSNSSRWRGYARAVASLGVQANIGTNDIRAGKLPLPPLSEQRVIATALSDVDELLGGLDRLIAKKRDLKQAAMQQLLTGQTRLPGFHAVWDVKRLGDLFNFSGGYSASRDELSTEGHCYLHYGDIHGSTKTCIDTDADFPNIPKLDIPLKRVSPASMLNDGDVVFVDASEDDAGTSKHVVVVNKSKKPFISGLHTIVAKSKTDELAHEFRRYCFQTPAIRQQFLFYCVGTKVSGISKSNIPKLTLSFPSLPEQTAIASVLTEMDGELAVLTQRREKTCALKQAMMQELLTGKTRLI